MFTKGQTVYVVRRNDSVMTWAIRPARVESCGKVRMYLTDAQTGECIGRDFLPREAQRGYFDGPSESYVLASDDVARIEALAEEMRAFELAMYRRQMELRKDAAGLAAVSRKITLLESAAFTLEPWCEWHPVS